MSYETFPYFQVLVLGLLFDVGVLVVVIAHIRFVASLNAQIMALEASTDMLLQSQRELNKLIISFLSKAS
jgi:nitrate reductase gamma subunit